MTTTDPQPAAGRGAKVRQVATRAAKATGRGASAVGRQAGRHTWTASQGAASWAKRAAAAASHGEVRDHLHRAKRDGDHQAYGDWYDRHQRAKKERLEHVVELPKAVLAIALLFAALVAVVAVFTFIGGVVVWLTPDGATWTSYWGTVGAVLSWIWWGLVTLFWAAAVVVPALLVYTAWLEGKRAGQVPKWLMTPAEKAREQSQLTPSKVVTAFRDLGITALTKAIKEMPDAGAAMLSPITLAGVGVALDVKLPSGVETDQVKARRAKLAENLDRFRHELHIALPPDQARTVRLWIADRGALDKPVGKSPLVLDPGAKADYRTGRAPWGNGLRGEPLGISLYQRHVLVTGRSNQGKTASLRALELWLAKDPRTRFWIADLKGPKDWAMFEGLAERLIIGPTDEHVIAATEMLEDAVAEMDRRTQAGGKHPPLIVVVDEAQVAYMCPAKDELRRPYGGQSNTSRFFMAVRKIQNQGRAVDVVLHQGTQDPTNQNLPKLAREGAHIRASLVVGTEKQAEMALGEAPVNAGAAPHELRQGLDKGVLVVAGDGIEMAPDELAITVRTHFIDDDEAAQIAEQAKALRKDRRRLRVVAPGEEGPDHLAAVARALGDDEKVRTVVLLGRLIEQDREMYEPWGAPELKAALDGHGVPIRKSDGQSVVKRQDVQRALEQRPTGT